MPFLALLEKDLSQRIRYIELLGEIDLSADQAKELEAHIAKYVQQLGAYKALEVLTSSYPVCLALCLVVIGISAYHEGNYWAGVEQMLAIHSPSTQSQLRAFFNQFVQAHGLAVLRGNGHKYVGSILLHGGIPDYSLHDFFEHFLTPAITRTEYAGLEAKDSIALWLEHSKAANIDKPIVRFLQLGGKIAVDFVARCMDMARYYSEQKTVPTAEELGLPVRVVESYRQWADKYQNTAVTARSYFVRPLFVVDPWAGFFIELPEQSLPSSTSYQSDACWTIKTDKGEIEVPCQLHWARDHYVTDICQLEITQPAAEYRVSLSVNGTVAHTWKFVGISAKSPLLFFDPQTQCLLQSYHQSIPARRLWLLYPSQQSLTVKQGTKCEVFPRLSDAWSDYRLEDWDLSSATELTIGSHMFSVESDLSKFQPYLKGTVVTGLLHTAGMPEVFAAAPEICIPLPPQRDAKIEMQRWRITIRAGEKTLRSVGILTEYRLDQHALYIPLSSAAYLGPNAMGRFEIALRGPLGRDCVFSFIIVPDLSIQVQSSDLVRYVDEQGKLSIPQVIVQVREDITAGSSDSEVNLYPGKKGRYHLGIPSECTQVEIWFQSKDTTQPQARISCKIALPVVRWTTIEGQMSVSPQIVWHREAITLSRAWLEQAEMPRLLISLDPAEGHHLLLSGKLVLSYDTDRPPQILLPHGKKSKWLIFNLAEAIDSIRASHEAFVSVKFMADGDTVFNLPLAFPVLRFSQTLELSDLDVATKLINDQWHMQVTWNSEQKVKNCHVFIWPLWRPWSPALDFIIPDAVDGEFELTISSAQLPSGEYRIEIAVIDPWSNKARVRPIFQNAGTIDIQIGTSRLFRQYHEALPECIQKHLEEFLSTSNLQKRVQLLKIIKKRIQRQDIGMVFETFLMESEFAEDEEWFQSDIYRFFKQLLLQDSITLLMLMWQCVVARPSEIGNKLKEWFYLLSPSLGRLVEQIQIDNSVSSADLIGIEPTLRKNTHIRAEVFASLQGIGITVQDDVKGVKIGNIADLYAELPEWLINSDNVLDSTKLYLREINTYPLLTAEQEIHLARQMHDGMQAKQELQDIQQELKQSVRIAMLQDRVAKGNEARRRLIEGNLRLVVNIAKPYIGRGGRELLDLVQEGSLGLMNAVEHFNEAHGYKFSTYATWWIRQAITQSKSNRSRFH